MPLGRMLLMTLAACSALPAHGCADPERERLKATTRASYDKDTGKLTELTYDANKDGRIDTWTEMDGTRPLRSRIDANEDGRVDRWEYYDQAGRLSRVGFSRSLKDQPDAWAYSTAEGRVDRIEISSTADPARIDRWEFYDTSIPVPTARDRCYEWRKTLTTTVGRTSGSATRTASCRRSNSMRIATAVRIAA